MTSAIRAHDHGCLLYLAQKPAIRAGNKHPETVYPIRYAKFSAPERVSQMTSDAATTPAQTNAFKKGLSVFIFWVLPFRLGIQD